MKRTLTLAVVASLIAIGLPGIAVPAAAIPPTVCLAGDEGGCPGTDERFCTQRNFAFELVCVNLPDDCLDTSWWLVKGSITSYTEGESLTVKVTCDGTELVSCTAEATESIGADSNGDERWTGACESDKVKPDQSGEPACKRSVPASTSTWTGSCVDPIWAPAYIPA